MSAMGCGKSRAIKSCGYEGDRTEVTEQLARLVKTLALPVTNQSLADLALNKLQESRDAARHGDVKLAAELEREAMALADLLC